MRIRKPRTSGRGVAYLTMILMLTLSVAGNVSHTALLNPEPGVRSLVYAVAWPCMVWLGVEMFVRVPWRDDWASKLVRWVGISIVSLIAGLVSYQHLRGLLKSDGEDWIVYNVGPLAIDGLMLMSTLALLLTRNVPAPATQGAPVPVAPRPVTATVGQPEFTLAQFLPQPVPQRQRAAWETVTVNQIEAPTHSILSYGPHPEIEAPRGGTPKPRASRNGSWDRARAAELIRTTSMKDAEIGAEVGTSYKTIQRYRKTLNDLHDEVKALQGMSA